MNAESSLYQTGYLPEVTDEEKDTVLTLDNIKSRMTCVKKMLDKGVLKEGKHYRMSEESGKHGLTKSGAEIIAVAFNLRDDSIQVDSIEQPFKARKFKLESGHFKSVKGYWSYKIKSVLHHKRTGEIWGSCLGICHSEDPGYEIVSPNTIIKVAGNRAFIGSIIKAVGCSDLFSIDDNDVGSVGSKSKQSNSSFPKRIKSKNGTSTNPWFCSVCKLKHIQRGDALIWSVDHNRYVPESCLSPDPRLKSYEGYSLKNIVEMVINAEQELYGSIDIPEHNELIQQERKRAVNNGYLDLPKLEKNDKMKLSKYVILISDKIKSNI